MVDATLARPLLWRAWREQGWKLVLVPMAIGAGFGVMCAVTWLWPGLLTGSSRYALEVGARRYFAALPGGMGIALALLFLQGPWLIAVFSAMRAASFAQGTVAGEDARGGFELLLAAERSPEQIFGGMLLQSLALTLLGWVAMAAAVLLPSAAVLAALGVRFHLPYSYYAAAFLLPIPMVLWANLIALLLGLRFPRLAQLRAGTSGSLLQLISTAPTLSVFVALSLRPGADLLRLSTAATLVGICGCVAAGAILRRQFRPEFFLES